MQNKSENCIRFRTLQLIQPKLCVVPIDFGNISLRVQNFRKREAYTQRNLFGILLNQPEIRLSRLDPNQSENGKYNLISG